MILAASGTVIIGSIILCLVIILGLVQAKIYNIIHGVISIFGMSTILSFVSFIAKKAGKSLGDYDECIKYTKSAFVDSMSDLFSTLNLKFMSDTSIATFYLIPIAIFIVSFILASLLKRIIGHHD